jgi:ComF family protein
VADALLSVLVAPDCAACGGALEHPTAGPVCERCWAAVLLLTAPLCERCGDPLTTWRAARPDTAARCGRCRRRQGAISRARAVGAYEGALRAIVHALKFDGRRSLARSLGALMRERGQDALAGADAVVPVPLHLSRRRQRGFNQAADLASYLGPPIVHALRRIRATMPQSDLPAAGRRRNVRGAFAPNRAAGRLRGAIVVLVDDVSTTGATLDACARALKAAGVREVRALTAARVAASPR